MFRVVRVSRAALASHRPILRESILSRLSVRRFVGDCTNRVSNIGVINAIISKTNGEGLPGTAARVGRAAFYLSCRNPRAAVEDVEKVLPLIQDDDIKRLAIGVRLRARNELLDLSEAALSVSGGTTEMEVSSLRSALREDYVALKAVSTGCWMVELGAAEFSLYDGKTKEAYTAFCDIEKKIDAYIASVEKKDISTEVASGENVHLSSLLAFKLARAHDAQGADYSVGTLVKESIKNIVDNSSVKETLTEFKKEWDKSITDEEAIELAYILEAARIRYHFHDYFPIGGEYNDWPSESALKIRNDILHVYSPASTNLSPEQLGNVKKAVPSEPFYAPQDQLRKFLSTPQKNILTEIRKTFGPGPQSPLSHTDEAYFESIKTLQGTRTSVDAAGCISFSKQQNEICAKLARQLLFRTRVDTALALTNLDRNQEAIEILNEVITANEYIYMWKAYLARGEANKRLGLISKSDKDFRQLSRLKTNVTTLAQ